MALTCVDGQATVTADKDGILYVGDLMPRGAVVSNGPVNSSETEVALSPGELGARFCSLDCPHGGRGQGGTPAHSS